MQIEIEKKWIQLDGEDPDKAGNCLMQWKRMGGTFTGY